MIGHLDSALEALLRARDPLVRRGDVDISFDTPGSDWNPSGRTLNVFLWDIRRSPVESQSGRVRVVTGEGVQMHKLAPPRVACRYLLTGWAKEARDVHRILSSALTTLLPIQQIPAEYLTGDLASSRPAPDLRTAFPNTGDFVDLWSSLQGSVRAGIDLVATMTVDTDMSQAAGPPIGGTRAVANNKLNGERFESELRGGRVDDPAAVDAIVRAPHDAALVQADGTFWIAASAGDEIEVLIEPPLKATVPPDGAPILVS